MSLVGKVSQRSSRCGDTRHRRVGVRLRTERSDQITGEEQGGAVEGGCPKQW